MTPPRRRSLLAYFILLATLIGVPASYSHVPETVFGVMVALGVVVVFLCVGLGLVNADAASELEKMLRGEGILARWTVPPEEWLEFQK